MELREIKVALLVANLRGGGAERMMANLARGFATRGLNVDLILGEATGNYLSEVPSSVNIIDLKSSRVLYSLMNLVKYLKRDNPDILISTLSRVNISAIIAKKFSRVKTKLFLREANTFSVYAGSNQSIWERLINSATKKLYPYGDAFIAVSEGVAEDLINNLKLDRSKVHVIYNPVVDDELFKKAKEPADHPWLKDKSIPVILGVGRISEQKDFCTLIRAFNEVRKQREARLIILGNKNEKDEEYKKLIELIGELNIEEYISMPGFVSNPFAYLSSASVFVLSSRWEGLPGVLIQALACGCPVISTDCPSGPREVLENGEFGKLAPIGDHKKISEYIIETIENSLDSNTLIERAKNFSVEKAVDQYLRLVSANQN